MNIENREKMEKRLKQEWYYKRFGVDETPIKTTPSQEAIKSKVVNRVYGEKTVIEFKGGVDFSKGGSIPF